MKFTGHKTESVYRRYAIVSESDMREGAVKLAALHANDGKFEERCGAIVAQSAKVADFEPVFELVFTSRRNRASA